MNYIFLIIVILIILLFIYFYYVKFNNKLEEFDNTRSSLSTYYQNNVDEDNYKTKRNIYNKVKPKTKEILSSINQWDGIWSSPSSNIYSQLIAVNDILLIAMSNSNLSEVISQNNTKNNYNCTANLFLGIGQLNIEKTNFILKKILCNNYVNQSLNFVVNGMSGYISNNAVTLYSSNNSITIGLIKIDKIIFDSDSFYKQSNFLKLFSPFIKNYPIMTRSTYSLSDSVCTNSSECKVTNMGLGDAFENSDSNACGNPVSATDNTCRGTPNCIFYSPAPNGYTTCTITNTITDYMNFSGLNLMSLQNGDTLEACSYLNYFGKNGFNSCIICYVSGYNTVHTLNYQFFGTLPDESTLTLQKDVVHDILLSKSGLVKLFRDKISSGSDDNSLDGDAILYEVTNPNFTNYTVNYSINNSSSFTGQINTITYHMEVTYNGVLYYTNVTFDAWNGVTIQKLGIPDASNGNQFVIQQTVYNMTVESNMTGISGLASPVTNGSGLTGYLQIWPYDYAPNPNGYYGYLNNPVYNRNYGAFQIFNITNPSSPETILAWNNHFYENGATPDIGLGNYLRTNNVDWTFSGSNGMGSNNFKLQISVNSNLNSVNDISDVLSLTNCMELNNTSGTPQQIIKDSLSKCNNYIKPLNNNNKKSKLKPTIWQINYNVDNNYINSCNFSLSTSSLYKLAVKYANFNDNETINLSLFGGDYKKNIILENSKILNNNDNNIIMSTNLKINSGLYLVPNIEKGGFSNDSNLLSFRQTPFNDGKWLIIGFNLKNIDNLDDYLSSLGKS